MAASPTTRPIDKDRVSLKSASMIAREKWLELKTAAKEQIRYVKDTAAPSLEETATDTLKTLEDTGRQLVFSQFQDETGVNAEYAWGQCTDAIRYYKMYARSSGEEKAAYRKALKDWLKRQPELYLKEGETLVNAVFAVEAVPILDNCRQLCFQGRQAALQGASQIADEWKTLKEFFTPGGPTFEDDPEGFDKNAAMGSPDSSSAAERGLYDLSRNLSTEEGTEHGEAVKLNKTMTALWDLIEVLMLTVSLLGRLAKNWDDNHKAARALVSDPITDCGQRKMAAGLGLGGSAAITQHLHGIRQAHTAERIHDAMDDAELLAGTEYESVSFRSDEAPVGEVDASVDWNAVGDMYLKDGDLVRKIGKKGPSGVPPIEPYTEDIDSSWVQTPRPGVPVRDLVGSLPSGAGGVLYDPAVKWAAFSDKSLIPSEVERTKMHLEQAVKDPSLGLNPRYPIINTSTWRDGSRLVNLKFQGNSWDELEDFIDNINGGTRLFNAADFG